MITDLQRRTLMAAAARILPSGDGPGAVETAAAEVCVRALADDFFRNVRPHVLHGLDELQAAARERCDHDFAACPATEQDSLLRGVEQRRDWRSTLFFHFLIHHTLEGFLGDPRHGGNRGGLGWSFIGYEPDRLRSGLCLGRQGPA